LTNYPLFFYDALSFPQRSLQVTSSQIVKTLPPVVLPGITFPGITDLDLTKADACLSTPGCTTFMSSITVSSNGS